MFDAPKYIKPVVFRDAKVSNGNLVVKLPTKTTITPELN